MTIASEDGERTVAADEFFLGVYLTAVGPGELLTKITIPAGKHDGFAAITLGADGTCIANAAASLNGSLRVALGCVDAVPIVVQPASADEAAVREAVRGAGLDAALGRPRVERIPDSPGGGARGAGRAPGGGEELDVGRRFVEGRDRHGQRRRVRA